MMTIILTNSCANFGQTNSERAVARTHNSTYKKLAVQCLIEALCFVSSSVLADSLVLRNRQLLVAANRVCPESSRRNRDECFTEDGRQNIIQKTEREVRANRMVGSLKK